MHELSGYVVSPRRDGDIALYRGSGTGLSPILLVAAEETSPGSVERLEHEYALKCELDPGWAARMTLVLEDPGGAPLDRLLGRPLDVSPFLRIAIPLAGALCHVHPCWCTRTTSFRHTWPPYGSRRCGASGSCSCRPL